MEARSPQHGADALLGGRVADLGEARPEIGLGAGFAAEPDLEAGHVQLKGQWGGLLKDS